MIRLKWKTWRVQHDYYKSERVQSLLEYFKEDIVDHNPCKKGVKTIWKDGYIAEEDITAY